MPPVHFHLTACCGDEPLATLDGRELSASAEQASFMTRALQDFVPEPSFFQVPDPRAHFTAGEQAAELAVRQIGVERVVAMANASPRLLKAMEAHVREELGMTDRPAPSNPFVRRPKASI